MGSARAATCQAPVARVEGAAVEALGRSVGGHDERLVERHGVGRDQAHAVFGARAAERGACGQEAFVVVVRAGGSASSVVGEQTHGEVGQACGQSSARSVERGQQLLEEVVEPTPPSCSRTTPAGR